MHYYTGNKPKTLPVIGYPWSYQLCLLFSYIYIEILLLY